MITMIDIPLEKSVTTPIKLYLAGAISGLSWEQATGWRRRAARELALYGIKTFSPLRYKDFLESETSIQDSYPDFALATPKAIYTRDKWDVSRCDILFVNLLGTTRVSIGTVMEIAWGDMLNKPIIIVAEKDNTHLHAMVRESAGYIV